LLSSNSIYTTMISTSTYARANLGPLTSTFTPPPDCTTALLLYGGDSTGYLGYNCITIDGQLWSQPAEACRPSRTVGIPPKDFGFFSPGLICPTGYTSACTATGGGHSDWNVEFFLSTSETAVGCCRRWVVRSTLSSTSLVQLMLTCALQRLFMCAAGCRPILHIYSNIWGGGTSF
jgi:hypothetical protein